LPRCARLRRGHLFLQGRSGCRAHRGNRTRLRSRNLLLEQRAVLSRRNLLLRERAVLTSVRACHRRRDERREP